MTLMKHIKAPAWKAWSAGILGTIASGVFTVSRGISSAEGLVDPDERLASAVGGGIAISLVVCLATYLLVYRQSSRRTKLLAFSAFIVAGILGAFVSVRL